MTVTINGTTGVAGVDGTAGTPSYQGNDSNTGVFFPAADTIAFAEGGAEVARFNPAGNFGVGTTNPVQKFVVSNAGAAGLEVDPTGVASGPYIQGYNRSTSAYIPLSTLSSYLSFRTGSSPTERMRVNPVGSLEYATYNSSNFYAGDATITLSGSTVTFDLVTLFPALVGNGAGMGIMLLINQWSGADNSGITQITLGQKSNAWSFSTVSTVGPGSGSSVSGSGTVITVTSGAGFGQIRIWVTSRN
jgi:hypothetical protein